MSVTVTVNGFHLLQLMVTSITVTVNLNHTVSTPVFIEEEASIEYLTPWIEYIHVEYQSISVKHPIMEQAAPRHQQSTTD